MYAIYIVISNTVIHTLSQTTEDDLRRLFLPYGPIHMISIPTNPPKEEGGQPRAKGFGFVWMLDKKDAEKAIEKTNGTTLGKKEGDSNAKGKERTIAVDWALSKEKWNTEKQNMEEDQEMGSSSTAEDDGNNDETSSSEEDDDHDDEDGGSSEAGDVHDPEDDETEKSNSEGDDDNTHERPRLPGPDTGNTLFIRNLPFTATEDELRALYVDFHVSQGCC